MNVGPLEIAIVVLVIVVLFGSRRLPELGSGLGRGLREFKDGITGSKRDEDEKEALGATTTVPARDRTPAPKS
jgi:sec-independent protein translocase protein TatA